MDGSEEVNALTASIKDDITKLSSNLNELEAWLAARRGQKGQTNAHSANVVISLRTQLSSATKSFKSVLETRTDSIKAASERRAMFGFSPQQLGKPLLFRPEGPQAAALHSGGASGGSSGGAGSAFDPSFAFQQVSQKQLTPQVDHFEQRARDVADVEKHILDLGTIFGKLQHMIHEQGDMLARVDDDVTMTLQNLESGEGQLWKKHDSLSSKWLFAKMGAILFLFLVLFMLFVV